jgi:hypothetical protein
VTCSRLKNGRAGTPNPNFEILNDIQYPLFGNKGVKIKIHTRTYTKAKTQHNNHPTTNTGRKKRNMCSWVSSHPATH